MKRTLAAVILFALAGALPAQLPADKAKAPAPEKKPAAAPAAPSPAAAAQPAPAPEKKAAPAAKPAPKQAEEPEEAMVMIDDRAEPDHGKAGPAEGEETAAAAPSGIPSSYGQLKGVLNEAGRNVLVFENPDSGAITFVAVTFGKNGVSWRLVDTLPRYGAESVAGGDLE